MFWPRLFTRMEILNAIGGGLQLKLKLSGNRKIRFDSNRMPHTHARMCTVLLFSLSLSLACCLHFSFNSCFFCSGF